MCFIFFISFLFSQNCIKIEVERGAEQQKSENIQVKLFFFFVHTKP